MSKEYKTAILTISDSRSEKNDLSGDAIQHLMTVEGFEINARSIVIDEKVLIESHLIEWSDSGDFDLILTTGGTGLGARDVTPEATLAVLDVEVPGISEAMRYQTLKKTPLSMLSRSISGIRSGCLIINLPGSPKAVTECLEVIMPALSHGLEMISGRRGQDTH
ncbi:MAG: MogA/MoaB family molybdenum cofactor biosynthesis protein [Chloroflexota bacterium]|nr:MogA/MoaB family molybdenum cofactor biosynthesis protein [Chloroflexota bacterium]